jgi:hypothetical protein
VNLAAEPYPGKEAEADFVVSITLVTDSANGMVAARTE